MRSFRELHDLVAKQAGIPVGDIPMEPPPSREMGDICFNLFRAAKLKKANPNELAKEIASRLQTIPGIVSATPASGFVNTSLEFSLLADDINRVLGHGEHLLPNVGGGRRIMVEYFSPNTNKPLHVGHLRNVFIGEALSHLLSRLGFTVIRANLYNDRGIHIAKAQLAYERFGNGVTPVDVEKKGDQFVGEYYVLFTKRAEADPDLEEEAQNILRRWEAEDRAVITGWQQMRDWVVQGFDETLDRLGIQKFDVVYHESEFWKRGVDVVRSGLDKGVFSTGQAGAIVAEVPGVGIRPVLRGDGTALYITQDIYLAIRKFSEYGPLDRSIYVVAAEQQEHFKVLFNILKQLGFEWADVCYHLGYGMILLKGGKLKSREGITADADSMINSLEQLAAQEIRNRQPSLQESEVEARANTIAVSLLKWEFLKVNTLSNINFSPETSLALNGDTGPYMLYTYARAKSLMRRAGEIGNVHLTGEGVSPILEEKELAVLVNLFPEILQQVAATYNFATLTAYLRLLADRFNTYYQSVKILDDDKETAVHRLSLSLGVGYTIKQGLAILGIHPLEEM